MKNKHRKSKADLSTIPLPGEVKWSPDFGYTDETPLKCNGKPDRTYSLQGERTVGEIKDNIKKVAIVLRDEYDALCTDLIALTAPTSEIRLQWDKDDLTRLFAAFGMRNLVKDVLMEKRPLTMKSEAVVKLLKELSNLGIISFQEDILPKLECSRQKFKDIVSLSKGSVTTIRNLEVVIENLQR
jgi:hypothetical protein